jgi:hypothetical protein
MKKLFIIFILVTTVHSLFAQSTGTAEDSLHRNLSKVLSNTSIGGYGNAFYQRDFNLESSTVNLERFVLFVGHKFSNRISLFTEIEIEDAKISGDEDGGEVALEQAYLKFNFNPNNYLVAGLFLPRIGILNENHLPTNFYGNERNRVETYILPTTWRELGVGFYGTLNNFPLSYGLGLLNGLNSAAFEHGSGIREGRFEGRNATANNLAFTAFLQLNKNNFKAQVSGYYGGSVGLAPAEADSLKLTSGIFGTPVIIGEADVQYIAKGFSATILATAISIPDAADINRAYANNTPENEYGGYAEVAYNIFETMKNKQQELSIFVRYEMLNMNAAIPSNGIIDETLNQQHVVVGINYSPIRNVVVKADVRVMHTGEENPDLIINPNPAAPPYQQQNTFLNLGIGFSF